METVLEWRPIIMVWFTMSVGMLQHKTDIYISYWLEDKLMRRVAILSPIWLRR
jgi:hypothetical protein